MTLKYSRSGLITRLTMWEISWKQDGEYRSVLVYPEDKADQIAYVNEGIRGGWCSDLRVEYITEEY